MDKLVSPVLQAHISENLVGFALALNTAACTSIAGELEMVASSLPR